MPSSVNEINSAFNRRLVPIAHVGASRPVNPFASTGTQTSRTKREEMKVRSSVALPGTLGTQYQGKVVDAKNDDAVRLDTYTVRENPNASTTKHTTSRLLVEHTRER
ncbi:unnamed protein product [Pylaiella littoralis]